MGYLQNRERRRPATGFVGKDIPRSQCRRMGVRSMGEAPSQAVEAQRKEARGERGTGKAPLRQDRVPVRGLIQRPWKDPTEERNHEAVGLPAAAALEPGPQGPPTASQIEGARGPA